MSFKREGDDLALLRNLKNRRVAEILATHIPEDEALLLKNGKYTCIVCRHRPICDTLDILAIHRKGRKHLENLSSFLRNREEIKNLIIQRRQEQTLKTGNSSINSVKSIVTREPTASSIRGPSLLKEIPYRRKCKRKFRLTDRKITLDINSDSNDALNSVSVNGDNMISQSQKLPSHAANATVKSYLKSIKQKGSFEELVEKSRNLAHLPTPAVAAIVRPENIIPEGKQKKTISGNSKSLTNSQNGTQRKKADFFLNLCRDGWKRNLDGTWTKDEDAEFDSDEETPPEYVE